MESSVEEQGGEASWGSEAESVGLGCMAGVSFLGAVVARGLASSGQSSAATRLVGGAPSALG
jgi:hypothetical protein